MRTRHPEVEASGARLAALALGATGVVYGDIGTSPLYTWSEVRLHGDLGGPEDILGVASVMFWTLTLSITGKYISIVLNADNHGEGGTFALYGLLARQAGTFVQWALMALVLGSTLLYADGVLTPAISVLAAVEGLQVVAPGFKPIVVPLAIAILSVLFYAQRYGTAGVGKVFGPVMVLWFVAIGGLGLTHIARAPDVLWALDPRNAAVYLSTHDVRHLSGVLGAAMLCITGGEALYADLGHFGAKAIRAAWVVLVYPALVCAYLGQAAFLMHGGDVHHDNVFFSSWPESLLVPAVLLATCATVVASQAMITGAYSVTRAAINLGLLPRLQIVHTSSEMEGQIYLPTVNALMWGLCIALVLFFGSSSAMAGAYGLAVMTVMLVTTMATGTLALRVWGWPVWAMAPFAVLACMEATYLATAITKFWAGGYVPVSIALMLFIVMLSWRSGRAELRDAFRKVERLSLGEFINQKRKHTELPRAMVFMSGDRIMSVEDPVPVVLMSFLQRYGALPKHVTLFAVAYDETVPYWTKERFEVEKYDEHVVTVRMHVGFMENPDVRDALRTLKAERRIKLREDHWTIVLGSEDLLLGSGPLLWKFRAALFQALMRFTTQAHAYFGLGNDHGVSREEIPIVVRPGGMEIKRPPR